MIEAQALNLAGADQFEQEPVCCLEHIESLHAQGSERVNVEEAAVVDLVGRDSPERETIRLFFQ